MMARRASASFITSITAALSSKKSNFQTKAIKYISTRSIHPSPTANDNRNLQKEEVVIIGAGVAGLAAAAMLHKLGIKSLVLEQADALRTGGVTISLSKNAWDALDAIGVGDDLRSQYFQIQGAVIKTDLGRKLTALKIPDDGSQELRSVERSALLEVLANQLPPNTVQYSSRLASIENTDNGEALLQLNDGTRLSAEVVIGCDGIRSQVAKWMGFREPKYAGHCAFRGLRVYSKAQLQRPVVNYIYGKGLRAGFLPASPTKIYWFIIHNSPDPGPMMTGPQEVKEKAKDLVRNMQPELLEMIEHTPGNKIVRSPLEDRWLWPGITPAAFKGRVVVAGDAWHPMTPNLGQGACSSLEDAVLLSRKIHGAIVTKQESIEQALKSYEQERWAAIFKLGIKSNLVGAFMQWENPVARYIRWSLNPQR
ncbi:hypothetical protein V2J09_020717 [Rumex salicifolius]